MDPMPLYYFSDLTRSQSFQPMAAQLSMKAALPLAETIMTALYHSSNRGGPLNINTPSYKYRHSYYKDRTVSRQSYLYNGNPIYRKTVLILIQGPGRCLVPTCSMSYWPSHMPASTRSTSSMLPSSLCSINVLSLFSSASSWCTWRWNCDVMT